MGKVVILPDALCNQIAAGEVVERPAAVVKELLENSIDAGSCKISVSLRRGGSKEIRVVDNGAGMEPDDALLALERHATSKIRSLEDLHAARSLGFRGEALPSIAAVSRFELTTRPPEAVSGFLARIEGGFLKETRETGCPPGTMVMVRDLFFNVPVRRKFLRTVDTEMSHVTDQFLRLALAAPAVHFQLSHEERLLYDFPRARNIAPRAAQVLGADLATQLVPFDSKQGSLHVHGLASPPDLQRSSGSSLYVTVNGRPVSDRLVSRAVLGAYDALLTKGKFPVVVLIVELPPEEVDVNVHPTKREVRFRSPGDFLDTVRRAIREGLGGAHPKRRLETAGERPAWTGKLSLEDLAAREAQAAMATSVPTPATPYQEALFPPPTPPGPLSPRRREEITPAYLRKEEPTFPHTPGERAPHFSPSSGGRSPGCGSITPEPPSLSSAQPAETGASDAAFFSRLPYLGQLSRSYILLEAPDGLILIDQHAAHERILYDRLTASTASEPAQRLLRPVVLDFPPREAALLRRWLDDLKALGFELEPFGGESFVVHAVPASLGFCPPDDLVRSLLEGADEDERKPRWDLRSRLAKTAACHSAFRAGERLREEELRYLLEALDRNPTAATCPHGRPLWVKLSLAEIARLFHRT